MQSSNIIQFGTPTNSSEQHDPLFLFPSQNPRTAQVLRSTGFRTHKDFSRGSIEPLSAVAPALAIVLHLQISCSPFCKLDRSEAQLLSTRQTCVASRALFLSSLSVCSSPAAEEAVAAQALLLPRRRSPLLSLPLPAACSSVKHSRSPPWSPIPPTPRSPGASTASPVVPLKPASFPPTDSTPPPRTFPQAQQSK